MRRSAQGSTLTDAGVLVAGWASEVLAAAARFEVAVDSLRESGSAQLTVSASLTVAEYLLPDWLVALRRADREPAERSSSPSAASGYSGGEHTGAW